MAQWPSGWEITVPRVTMGCIVVASGRVKLFWPFLVGFQHNDLRLRAEGAISGVVNTFPPILPTLVTQSLAHTIFSDPRGVSVC